MDDGHPADAPAREVEFREQADVQIRQAANRADRRQRVRELGDPQSDRLYEVTAMDGARHVVRFGSQKTFCGRRALAPGPRFAGRCGVCRERSKGRDVEELPKQP